MYEIDASPCPVGLVRDTQLALLLAAHVQSRVVPIDNVPVPPPSGNDDDEVATWNWHFCVAEGLIPVDVCVSEHATSREARFAAVRRNAYLLHLPMFGRPQECTLAATCRR